MEKRIEWVDIYIYLFDLSFVAIFYFQVGYLFKTKRIFETKINHYYLGSLEA